MQTISVKNIEQKQTKDGSKTFFIITDSTNAQFSLWEPIGMIKTGCVIEAEIEVKGKYANIKNFKITGQSDLPSPTAPANAKPAFGQDSPEKRASIERQTALIQSVAYLKDIETADPWYVLEIANTFYQWIAKGTIPSTTEPPKAVASGRIPDPTTKPTQDKDAMKATPANITPEQVTRDMARTIHENLVSIDQCKKMLAEAGAKGEKSIDQIKSLSSENLAKINAKIQDILKPLFVE